MRGVAVGVVGTVVSGDAGGLSASNTGSGGGGDPTALAESLTARGSADVGDACPPAGTEGFGDCVEASEVGCGGGGVEVSVVDGEVVFGGDDGVVSGGDVVVCCEVGNS